MEKGEEMRSLYERLLQQITLYNQCRNNIDFEKAKRLSELVMDINDLAIRLGILRDGDAESELMDMEMKLKYQGKSKSIIFV